jgi:hypothetical protein
VSPLPCANPATSVAVIGLLNRTALPTPRETSSPVERSTTHASSPTPTVISDEWSVGSVRAEQVSYSSSTVSLIVSPLEGGTRLRGLDGWRHARPALSFSDRPAAFLRLAKRTPESPTRATRRAHVRAIGVRSNGREMRLARLDKVVESHTETTARTATINVKSG